jgi:hypothetical protein
MDLKMVYVYPLVAVPNFSGYATAVKGYSLWWLKAQL